MKLSITKTPENRILNWYHCLPEWIQETLVIVTDIIVCAFLLVGICIAGYNSG